MGATLFLIFGRVEILNWAKIKTHTNKPEPEQIGTTNMANDITF